MLRRIGVMFAGEPAAVSEALGAITALAVSGDSSLVNAVAYENTGA